LRQYIGVDQKFVEHLAVMRKRLHTIYGVLKNKTPYDANMFYQNGENLA